MRDFAGGHGVALNPADGLTVDERKMAQIEEVFDLAGGRNRPVMRHCENDGLVVKIL
ncbi:hypothetical protein D3C81_1999450 [compost metagenome]